MSDKPRRRVPRKPSGGVSEDQRYSPNGIKVFNEYHVAELVKAGVTFDDVEVSDT